MAIDHSELGTFRGRDIVTAVIIAVAVSCWREFFVSILILLKNSIQAFIVYTYTLFCLGVTIWTCVDYDTGEPLPWICCFFISFFIYFLFFDLILTLILVKQIAKSLANKQQKQGKEKETICDNDAMLSAKVTTPTHQPKDSLNQQQNQEDKKQVTQNDQSQVPSPNFNFQSEEINGLARTKNNTKSSRSNDSLEIAEEQNEIQQIPIIIADAQIKESKISNSQSLEPIIQSQERAQNLEMNGNETSNQQSNLVMPVDQIKIQLNNSQGESITVYISKSSTLQDLKNIASQKFGYQLDNLQLEHNEIQLSQVNAQEVTLSQLGFKDGASFKVVGDIDTQQEAHQNSVYQVQQKSSN